MPINCEDSRVWLVAHVRLFHEKKCAERLSKLNIKTYLPLRGELHYWKDRKKRIDSHHRTPVCRPQTACVPRNAETRGNTRPKKENRPFGAI